jgi:2-oxoglutarate dehydrogenase E1 component
MQVIVPSTAAQMFHALRRQLLRKMRIPLIIMSPKSMLRRKDSFSPLEDLSRNGFQTLIPETNGELSDKDITRVVFCSGKVYYELAAKRAEQKMKHAALLRIEQLYPFDADALKAQMARYPNATDVVWCQEEPINQGAWYQIQHQLRACIRDDQNLHFSGRVACSAPAGGSILRHNQREKLLIHASLGLELPVFT